MTRETGPPAFEDRWYYGQFWLGFGFPAWARLLAGNPTGFSADKLLDACLYSLVSPGNSLAGLLQDALEACRGGPVGRVVDPLFVLGHWRTGTTLLHELLALDPGLVAPTTYQCLAPHHFPLSQWLVPRLLPFLMPPRRPMDSMPAGWDRPQEDEVALAALGLPSPYLRLAFGRPVHDEYLDFAGVPEAAVARWGQGLRTFVDRVAAGAPGRRVVLKSPTHTGRVATLLRLFPGARFLHLVRHPARVFPSTVHLWRSLGAAHRLGSRQDPGLEEHVLATLPRMYAAFDAAQAALPPGRHHLLRYEDLVADPIPRLREAYLALGLGDPAPAEPAWRAYLASAGSHRPNRFAPDPARDARVMDRWSAYAASYGYAPLTTPAGAA